MNPTTALPNFRDMPGFRLRAAYLLMHRRSNAHFAPLGISVDQFVLMGLLREVGECTQRELADLSYADVNTIAAMLRLLERQKLVCRRPHSGDGRAKVVTLTATGRSRLGKCMKSAESLHASLDACFPEPHKEHIFASLHAVVQAMKNGDTKSSRGTMTNREAS